MADTIAVLERARTAYRSGDWDAARDDFATARRDHAVTGDDVRALAACEWWLGRQEACLDHLESAFRMLSGDGDDMGAAETALVIALVRLTRAELTVGTAWARRAHRMLADLPDGRAHAYDVYLTASMDLDGTGSLWPADSVSRMQELAATLRSPAVSALSAVVTGMHDIRAGRTAEGFAQLDEAMLCVVSDELEPEWAGDVLCTTIHVCHELADFRRMSDWTRAAEAWCAARGNDVVYAGVCRVHRLELQSVSGEWDAAESALQRACDDLGSDHPWVAGEGWYQVGEIRRLRGDAAGAREAYGRARSAGIDPVPGEALLVRAEGDAARAAAMITASLEQRDRMGRARLLRPGVEIALAVGRPDWARQLVDELEADAGDFGSEGFQAWAAHAAGMVLVHEGDAGAAIGRLHAALDLFRRLRQPWEQANVLSWLASAHELQGEAALAAELREQAQDLFVRLGAPPVVVHGAAVPGAATGPLTARESEIVELVARGRSNREIAAELFISEKTVSRHLANVYLKLDVGSRTAAAAWWHDAGRRAT
ncbi:LuxR C-terminal-related transcriptional regulator [Microbacterium sp. M3]|uniref:LuxR C-terminal-related transcriptional regulator n=1 Tax=Microbacterium arthrosphaerae TaxID=792652 RepID=A0ABU4H7B1_9MICO|nr:MULTISPECIES: LuxR C-terminal-related transcriptional regulator [Microbacterium]MDW4573769.1 LuxR C-terminal-related transcriptional regulator [Microbacterium arthrosphaerae]MDW7607624.1 LuxR C-terminal-related transcriptional regulator [Microbacterium sp. M3]